MTEAAFEFGKDADHPPHGAACRRRGVDCFRKGIEFTPRSRSRRAWRLAVEHEIPSSIHNVLQPAFFKAAIYNAEFWPPVLTRE